jgi:Ankyrin repeats (3 copies)
MSNHRNYQVVMASFSSTMSGLSRRTAQINEYCRKMLAWGSRHILDSSRYSFIAYIILFKIIHIYRKVDIFTVYFTIPNSENTHTHTYTHTHIHTSIMADLSLKLVEAAELGLECHVIQLLSNGADPNYDYMNQGTPLWKATWGQYKGHPKCIKVLILAPGIDVNKGFHDGTTPLWHAAYHGRFNCIEALLAAKNIKVNATDVNGNTALMIATDRGMAQTVRLLLKANGIDINVMNNKGKTALMLAADNDDITIERMLKKATREQKKREQE